MEALAMGVAHNGMKVLYGDNFVAQSVLFSAHHLPAQARYGRYSKRRCIPANPATPWFCVTNN
jgi:hypothetical protein